MNLYSPYNRQEPRKYAQKKFPKTQDVYEDIFDEKEKRLITKKTDVNLFYDEIQEATESVYLPSILEKYKIDINKKALIEIDTNVMDVRDMPTDMLGMMSFITNQQLKFQKLPAELKKQFNNNYITFLEAGKTGQAQKMIEEYNKEIRIKKGLEAPKKAEEPKQEKTEGGVVING